MQKRYVTLGLCLTDRSDAATTGQFQARLVISAGCEVSSGSAPRPVAPAMTSAPSTSTPRARLAAPRSALPPLNNGGNG